ncbi:TPA: DUF362 domain-containing protein [Candidatus Poribacteria bacterium]|nr:DUF362 domain-containing protein [Candidatus Poribacteria bacterium]
MRRISRRDFIKTAVAGGIGAVVIPGMIADGSTSRKSDLGKIVFIHDKGFSKDMRVNPGPLRSAVDSLIKELTGEGSISEAWRKILVGYKRGDMVGIKVNVINRRCPSHPELVYALCESLKEFGVPENDIVIWDRKNRELERAGYKLNDGKEGIRCFGTDSPGWGYEEKPTLIEGQEEHLSKILTRCDHLINVPVLKDHRRAGVTISMKNHYGSIDSPNLLHDNNCDPFLARLNAIPEIRDKTRLILLDGIVGICKGGPGGPPQFSPNILAASFDTVAIDKFALNLINEERRRRELDEATGMAKHIRTAASIGLGTDDEDKIKIVRI